MSHIENYQAENPPDEAEPELARYIFNEFQRISIVLDLLMVGHVEETNITPDKPRTGDVRLADGTNWNPGSGRGVYWYDGVSLTWKFMG